MESIAWYAMATLASAVFVPVVVMAQSTTNMLMIADTNCACVPAMNSITDPYMLKPTLTADGRPWIQRCFICAKPVDYLKTSPVERVKVGELVRHKACKPKAVR